MADASVPPTARLVAFGAAYLGAQFVTASCAAFLPTRLEVMGAGPFLIALLLALDPLGGMLVQPFVNVWSDRTRTRWGRRFPFIAGGAAVTVLGVLGLAWAGSPVAVAWALGLTFLGYNLYVGPYRASLAEQLPASHHTLATGFQTLFRGLGLGLAFTAGAWLAARDAAGPFWLAAAAVAASTAWTLWGHERRPTGEAPSRPPGELWSHLRQAGELKKLLAAQFCWWFALYGMVGFMVLFAVHDVARVQDVTSPAGMVAAAQAASYLAVYSLVGTLLAVPVGRFAQRHGKRQVLTAGLAMTGAGLLLGAAAPGPATAVVMTAACGVGFACVQVVPFTMLLELQPEGHEGAFTALFSFFTNLPQVLVLTTCGLLIELSGNYRIPFWLGAVAIAAAIVLVQAIRLPSERPVSGAVGAPVP